MIIKDITLKLGLIGFLLFAVVGCSTDRPVKDTVTPASSSSKEHSIFHLFSSSGFSSDDNVWTTLGKDMQMDHYAKRADVQAQIQWYMAHTDYLERTANRASPYVYYILQEIKKRDMPAELALLPVIESGYNPFAHSGAGAAGLWQIMPSTAIGFSLRENWWYDGRRDFYAATPAALDYLQYLSVLFHGDWLLAIAAYNSGEGTVNAAIRYNHKHNRPTDFWDLKLPEQTRQYVPSLLALAIIVSHPDEYPINWPDTKVEPAVAAVHVGGQIDLDKAAQMAGISVDEIYYLNPGCTRWATDPTGDHMLIIPANKVDDFKENLAKMPPSERVSWDAYHVKLTDTIEKIAKKFRTTPKVIQQVNHLPSRKLQAGSTLLLPKSQATVTASATSVAANPTVQDYAMNNRTIAPPEPETYTVHAHDTLKSIARQQNVDIRNLMFFNQLRAKDKLTPGTTLILRPHSKPNRAPVHTKPVRSPVNSKAAKLPLNSASDESAPSMLRTNDSNVPASNASILRPNRYEVQPGDTVITIAHKFGVNAKVLKTYNNLDSDLLHVGQMLQIPPQ